MYEPEFLGVDRNRVDIFNERTRRYMIDALKDACTAPVVCANVPDDNILGIESGYMAEPLDGIWARAPYLHNGSVPTLRHLLSPGMRLASNARKFWRGNPSYDTINVGFTWVKADGPAAKPFDTSLEGFANTGHTGQFLRQDGDPRGWWGPELDELLEYLKTL
jgi:hypothetical protein